MQIGCHKDNDDDTAACKSQCVLIYAASKHSWIKQLALLLQKPLEHKPGLPESLLLV